jgi:hypothetical protein
MSPACITLQSGAFAYNFLIAVAACHFAATAFFLHAPEQLQLFHIVVNPGVPKNFFCYKNNETTGNQCNSLLLR